MCRLPTDFSSLLHQTQYSVLPLALQKNTGYSFHIHFSHTSSSYRSSSCVLPSTTLCCVPVSNSEGKPLLSHISICYMTRKDACGTSSLSVALDLILRFSYSAEIDQHG